MTGPETDLRAAVWHKSSYSNGSGGDCVEITDHVPGVVPVRDSKAPQGPVLLIPAPSWSAFVGALKNSDAPTS
ncbi:MULTISPECIES: DUF397 domain-containing protein [unclassified Streptomyces]|uniref:DUF397 domain-containing protein n=1 Tax=unclassified Streptomyces TaxID=2593676 RepID=UPI000BF9954E|nr:DUF397 domain-containing protein [Streptomyces sp. Ru87]PGH47362.1 DUF397 domain-containing protein [Streptomyces sp. Ru87]